MTKIDFVNPSLNLVEDVKMVLFVAVLMAIGTFILQTLLLHVSLIFFETKFFGIKIIWPSPTYMID